MAEPTIDEILQADKAEAEEPVVVELDSEDTPLEAVRAELKIGDNVDPLAALLDASDEPPTEDVFIRRLGTYFTVQAITDDKVYEKLTERCTIYVKNRRGAGRTKEIDGRRLARLTVAEYTMSPVFTRRIDPARFQALADRYGTEEPEDLVDAALLMGEIDLLADKILTISGFDDELETAGN